MTEQRRAKRVKEEAQVTINLFSSETFTPPKKITYHLTKDISSKGLRIMANTFLPVNSMLKIELSLTKPLRFITAFGKIRWVKTRYPGDLFEIGVEFVDTSEENIKAIKNHIEKSESDASVS